jgi:hypothetical protein
MAEFISLEELRDRVWPLALAKHLATDMTGISLPILTIIKENPSHPYQVVFLLYYAVPNDTDIAAPPKITRAYAWITLDLQSGEFVTAEIIGSENDPRPLIGPGTRKEVFELSDTDRSNLQDLFFSRCNEAAQIYASGNVLPAQTEHLADLVNLYDYLSEPPLKKDYENIGKTFFSWLRANGKSATPK